MKDYRRNALPLFLDVNRVVPNDLVYLCRDLVRCAIDSATGQKVYVDADSFEPRADFSGLVDVADNPPMNDQDLCDFYVKLGFEPVPGHPFSLVLRRNKAESYA